MQEKKLNLPITITFCTAYSEVMFCSLYSIWYLALSMAQCLPISTGIKKLRLVALEFLN
jgi:hypothetical protein